MLGSSSFNLFSLPADCLASCVFFLFLLFPVFLIGCRCESRSSTFNMSENSSSDIRECSVLWFDFDQVFEHKIKWKKSFLLDSSLFGLGGKSWQCRRRRRWEEEDEDKKRQKFCVFFCCSMFCVVMLKVEGRIRKSWETSTFSFTHSTYYTSLGSATPSSQQLVERRTLNIYWLDRLMRLFFFFASAHLAVGKFESLRYSRPKMKN